MVPYSITVASRIACAAISCLALAATCGAAAAQEVADKPRLGGAGPGVATPPEDEKVVEPPKLPEPEGARKLPDPDRVWVDAKRKQVLVDGYVTLREGFLEMFACKVGTKEHESIVAVRSQIQTVHAALLAVGAKSGEPVQYVPEFKPPSGDEIAIEVRWLDDQGKWQAARAQEWVLNQRTNKPLKHPWVFAGSSFWKDPETGKSYYTAEQGDFICVSNFTTAMLDLPIPSTQANDGLMFVANTAKVPPLGTPVRLVLMPKSDPAQEKPSENNDGAKPAR
ncbi:MAG: hypothetical protein DCC67_10775 [Planctomycetota bacterium]|nr:MAG: hypothetical protein DCC67_10775 [Planctomycetota bacterium]